MLTPQHLRQRWLVLATASGIGTLAWLLPVPLQQWEVTVTGWAQEWRGQRPPSAPVTLVAIDDFSLQQAANADLSRDPALQAIQQWPWPRAVHARVLERLYAAGARVVGLDLLFDSPSGHGPSDDKALASTLRRHPGKTALAAMVLESKGDVASLSLSPPLALLSAANGVKGTALLNGLPEADGSIRGRPGDYAKTLQRQLNSSVPPGMGETLLQLAGISDRSAPPSRQGNWRGLLEMYGPAGTIPTISVWNLLEKGAFQQLRNSGRLHNQLVLVGPTAAVFQDRHRTPFSSGEGIPGVEIHATELANRLEGRGIWLWQPGRWWGLVLGLIALSAGLLAERWEKPLRRLAATGGLGVGLGLAGVISVGSIGVGANLFGSAAAVIVMAVISSGEATVRLEWQRRRLRKALGRYLSPAVAAEIASQPAEADGLLGGRSADVVVLITDIRGFTARTRAMSEAGCARQLVDQLNAYFSELVEALHQEGATVDKFIGDASLAIFGAPLHRGNRVEAAAALRAALDIRRRLRVLNHSWQQQGREAWQQVMVLHFGPVIAGNIGSSSRMDYTVIGDGVNTASRLEAIAKQCNRDLIMSSAFRSLLDDDLTLEALGEFELRGHGREAVFSLQ